MKVLLLFTIVAVAILGTANANDFPGVINILDEMLTGGFGSCAGQCLVPKIEDISRRVQQQCQPVVEQISREAGGVNSFTDFYNIAVRRQSGNTDSKMCKWIGLIIDECAVPLAASYCSDGIVTALRNFYGQMKPYICERNPPFLECILSPTVVEGTDFTGCVQPLTEKFAPYFNSTDIMSTQNSFFTSMRRFYNEQVKPNNGEKIYSAMESLGSCVSNKIGQASISPPGVAGPISCSPVRDVINDEVKAITDYFRKTDILQCAVNPDLWQQIIDCAMPVIQRLAQDPQFRITSTLSPNDDPSRKIIEALGRGEYYRFKTYYNDLKNTCLLGKVESVCGRKWTYDVLSTQLAGYDAIVDPNTVDSSGYCNKFNAGSRSTATTVAMTLTLAAAAAINL